MAEAVAAHGARKTRRTAREGCESKAHLAFAANVFGRFMQGVYDEDGTDADLQLLLKDAGIRRILGKALVRHRKRTEFLHLSGGTYYPFELITEITRAILPQPRNLDERYRELRGRLTIKRVYAEGGEQAELYCLEEALTVAEAREKMEASGYEFMDFVTFLRVLLSDTVGLVAHAAKYRDQPATEWTSESDAARCAREEKEKAIIEAFGQPLSGVVCLGTWIEDGHERLYPAFYFALGGPRLSFISDRQRRDDVGFGHRPIGFRYLVKPLST